MAKLLARGLAQDGMFRLVQKGELKLLYRCSAGKEQLVIPSGGGLRTLLLQEMHSA